MKRTRHQINADIQAGLDAEKALNALAPVLQSVREDVHKEWEQTPDSGLREALWFEIRAMTRLLGRVKTKIKTGELAKTEQPSD